jgi:hypothetical protein
MGTVGLIVKGVSKLKRGAPYGNKNAAKIKPSTPGKVTPTKTTQPKESKLPMKDGKPDVSKMTSAQCADFDGADAAKYNLTKAEWDAIDRKGITAENKRMNEWFDKQGGASKVYSKTYKNMKK